MAKKVLVVGATGLVGSAVVQHLRSVKCDVIAAVRTPLKDIDTVRYVSVDLFNSELCDSVFSEMLDVTHLVYAALYERSSLVDGWSDEEQIAINDQMFKNVLDPYNPVIKKLPACYVVAGDKSVWCACALHSGSSP